MFGGPSPALIYTMLGGCHHDAISLRPQVFGEADEEGWYAGSLVEGLHKGQKGLIASSYIEELSTEDVVNFKEYSWLGLDFDHFSRGSQLHTAQRAPCDMSYVASVPTRC